MFTVSPYDGSPANRIHFDGSSVREGMPAAIEMAGSFTYIDDTPIAHTPDTKQLRPLNPPERAALALTGLGFNAEAIDNMLNTWYDPADTRDTERSLYGAVGMQHGSTYDAGVMIGEMYRRGVLVPEAPPTLYTLTAFRQQRLLEIGSLASVGVSNSEIGSLLGIKSGTVSQMLHELVEQLHLPSMRCLGQMAVMLLGTTGVLSRIDKDLSPREILETINSEAVQREYQQSTRDLRPTKELIYTPFYDTPIYLRFSGQPEDSLEPQIAKGRLEEVGLFDALITVHDVSFPGPDGAETRLSKFELGALIMRAAGVEPKVITSLTKSEKLTEGGRHRLPELNAYSKLLPSSPRYPANATLNRAIRAAFEYGILTCTRPPRPQGFPVKDFETLCNIGNHLAEGRNNTETSLVMGMAKAWSDNLLSKYRARLGGVSRSAVVLIAEAEKYYRQPKQKNNIAVSA